MSKRMKRFFIIFIGLAVSVFSLWKIFSKTPLDDLLHALQTPNYWWLLPNLFFVVLGMFQRAYRWQIMISPLKKVKYSTVLAATCIGFMANNILPLRLGEYARAYSLSKQDSDISKSSSLATIFVERMVFDLIALLIIFAGVLYISPLITKLDETLVAGIIAAISAAFLGLIFILILAIKPNQSGKFLTKYLFFLPQKIKNTIHDIVIRFSDGLSFMKDIKKLLNVTFHTLLLWLFMGLSNYFVFYAFGFYELPLAASYVLLVVVSVLILAPSSPGFVGVYHAGTILTLTLYGVAEVESRAFSIVLHLAQYIPITLLGFYFLKKAHLSLKTLEEESLGDG